MGEVIVVTGTDTDVGKTVATAALAASLVAAGARVAVYKPVQTGVVRADEGDVPFVRARVEVPGQDGVRLRAPMAPRQAAALEGAALPSLAEHLAAISQQRVLVDVVLVEGSGGLLVELDEAGQDLADLAGAAAARVVLVARSGLGTLNHTALTIEALQRRGLPVAGVIIGALAAQPSPIEQANLEHLKASSGVPLLGILPAGAAALDPAAFRAQAPDWLPTAGALVRWEQVR